MSKLGKIALHNLVFNWTNNRVDNFSHESDDDSGRGFLCGHSVFLVQAEGE